MTRTKITCAQTPGHFVEVTTRPGSPWVQLFVFEPDVKLDRQRAQILIEALQAFVKGTAP